MDFKSSKIRLAVAAGTVGVLSLTSGCLIGGGLPPDPIAACSAANQIRLEADLDATYALIDHKQAALENGDVPDALIPATEDALDALYDRASALESQLKDCEYGEQDPSSID